MDQDAARREELTRFYDELSPVEKQRRLVLEPTFRDAYNEITHADRFSPVPWYFWEKWAPQLNPLLITVYLKIRTFVFFNRQTGDRREVVWPKQEKLAAQVGSNRKSVMRALRELEKLGVISSEKGRLNHPKTGHLVNGTKKYQVFFELPLVAEDAVELLLRRTAAKAKEGLNDRESQIGTFGAGSRESRKGTSGSEAVDNSDRESQIGTPLAVPNRDSKTSTRTNTPNVTNVDSRTSTKKTGTGTLKDDPRVVAMSPEERASKESLTFEVEESLKRMAQDRSSEPHRSLGLLRRICFLAPEDLVREALISTRDAVEEQRSGRKSLREGPAGYFTGIMRQMETEHGLALGVRWGGGGSRPEPQKPRRAPEPRPTGRSIVPEAQESEPRRGIPESAKAALREMFGDKFLE